MEPPSTWVLKDVLIMKSSAVVVLAEVELRVPSIHWVRRFMARGGRGRLVSS